MCSPVLSDSVTKNHISCLSEKSKQGNIPSMEVEYEMAIAYTKYGRGKEYFNEISERYKVFLQGAESRCIASSGLPSENVQLLVAMGSEGKVIHVGEVAGSSAFSHCVAMEFMMSKDWPSHDLGFFNIPYAKEI